MTKLLRKERLLWLDWMKVLAVFSIVWGHFFSLGHVYLYVFSVQTFCLISGFLYKKAHNWESCLNNCFWQLFVPTVIMSVMMHLEAAFRCWMNGVHYDISWLWFCKWLILGDRWCMGPCWYFYTLIVMRLIMQLLPERKWVYILLFIMLSGGAIILQIRTIEASNAIVNVVVCMPIFLIGVFLKPFAPILNGLHHYGLDIAMFVCSIAIIVLCGNYNGYVWMYLNGYGQNYILFVIGAMAGSLMLYVISRWLSRMPYVNMVRTLAQGSILIIGLHIIIVRRLTLLPDRFWIEDLIFSVLILLAFIPIIHLADYFCPFIIGKANNKNIVKDGH